MYGLQDILMGVKKNPVDSMRYRADKTTMR